MMKLLEYILKRGAEVEVTAIPAPPPNPETLKECFEKIFQHEVDNTKAIYKLVKMSLEEEDWATWNLLQWFVKEQTEEETLAMNLLDKIKIAGGEKMDPASLYSLDRDLEKTPDDARLAQDVTTDNP
jgi:ferritin